VGWAVGFDRTWNRDIGYGVPSTCDHPGCDAQIDRGKSYCCGDRRVDGCGLFFCGRHLDADGQCARCSRGQAPFEPSPDLPEWVHHKATDPSWSAWRTAQAGLVQP